MDKKNEVLFKAEYAKISDIEWVDEDDNLLDCFPTKLEFAHMNPRCCLVAQLCPTLSTPWTVSPPGSSVHGIFQARIPEWVAISSSRGSS